MLRIISAPPGGGKTTYIYEHLRAAAEASKAKNAVPKQMLLGSSETGDLTRPLIIVPEQFHFETEHILYKKLGASLIASVEITSFTKLSSDINNIFGKAKPYAERTIREITMFRVLAKLGNEKGLLNYYTIFNKKKSEFASGIRTDTAMQILTHIESFQKEGYKPNELEEIYLNNLEHTREENDNNETNTISNIRLWRKISDLAIIYKAYNEELNNEFSDKLDDIVKAAELAILHGYFKDREIFMDGFDGFSGSQFKLINSMLRDCKRMTVSLLSDKLPSDKDIYKTSSSLYVRLKEMANKFNIKIVLQNLNKNPVRSPQVYPHFIAPDVYTECDYVAAKIRELVTSGKYTFNEIAVLGLYKNMSSAFNTYDISAFMDIPSPVIEKPFVRFLITVLEAASFKPEKLMLYIKSGFVRIRGNIRTNKELKLNRLKGKEINKSLSLSVKNNVSDDITDEKIILKSIRLSRQDISSLEEAARKWRLSSKNWRNSFPDKDRTLKRLEPLRKKIINPLLEFSKKINNTTGDKITHALADFLINKLEIQRTILSIVNKRTSSFKKGFNIDQSLNDEYRQLWETIISVLEAMYDATSDYPISVEEYTSILVSVLSKTDIARPPQVLDAVTVGDVERSRTNGVKVAFIMGVNQGVFPKSLKINGEFNSDEIEELSKAGLEIYENRTDRYYREQFVVNKALSIPSERLYLSASLSGFSWEALELSPLLNGNNDYNVKIPNERVTPDNFPISFWTSTEAAAKNILAKNMENSNVKNAIRSALLKHTHNVHNNVSSEKKLQQLTNEEVQDIINSLDIAWEKFNNANISSHIHQINKDTAKIILETNRLSPSGIELLNSCSFKYFCERGLRIQTAEIENDLELNQLQRGNLIHYCLYRVLGTSVNSDWFTSLKPAQLAELSHTYVSEFIEKELLSGYARTNRQNNILYNYVPRIVRMLKAVQLEYSVSGFKPYALEESFSFNLAGLEIAGKTDRYDVLTDGTNTYIKVIDYKTGKNVFNYPALYHGLGMQSLVYLFGVLEKHPNWIPSGAYYYSENIGYKTDAVLPEKETLQTSEKDEIRSWAESHKHAGILFANEVGLQDAEITENAIKNASGYPNSRKKLIEHHFIEQVNYEKLKEFTGGILNNRLNELYNGKVWALPIKDGQKKPCNYCEYKNFCGNSGNAFIEIEKGGMDRLFSNE